MKEYIVIFWSTLLIFGAPPASAAPAYPHVYQFYMELGKLALEERDYQSAYSHFRHAQAVGPNEKEPAVYLNLLKRLEDERVEPRPVTSVFPPSRRSRAEIIEEALDRYESDPDPGAKIVAAQAAGPPAGETDRKIAGRQRAPAVSRAAPAADVSRRVEGAKATVVRLGQDVVYLNDGLWQTQPGTRIRIELETSTILDASNIQRYLMITPDFIEVERIDKDRINIVARRRGSTFLHVWDDTGRWTFNVEVILPVRRTAGEVAARQEERYVSPFRLSYNTDWNSFYVGSTFREVERQNLNFLQQVLLEGETPYGDFDSYAVINKFDESTEVTGYGVGLTDGKIGDFKDFTIRGFDTQKIFSPLSMPGQYVRGVLFEAKAFDQNIEYSYLRGRDRVIFGFLAPDVLEKRESFVEGARLTLFPQKENQYSFNFARGYGEAREPFLKDKVFSVEAQRRLKNILLSSELAYDENATAVTAGSHYSGNDHSVTVNFRDVESDFTTVTSLPGNRGEVGGSILWGWRLSDVDVNTYLDLYRERFLPNPEGEDTLNVDFSTTVDVPISATDRLRTAVYYVDTSGELSPRNNVRLNTTYTKRFRLGEREMTAFFGLGQQRSRFDLSPASEFDRFSASSGFSIPLVKQLHYFTNYEHSWVYEEQSGDLLTPNVLTSGLNYSRRLSDGWSVHSAFSYRNEENTSGTNSFLAGEDSITGSLGTTFRPSDDFEFFLDGRIRNVWAEEESRAAFNEIDVRAGIRTSWELPFSWNPAGTVAGIVYKDLDGNQRQDEGEAGMPGVIVKIGNQTAVTDTDGFYYNTVRAKSVDVAVDVNSIPDGFIFSTPSAAAVEIIPHKIQNVDFGLTAQSGVYGIVFYDKNNSGRPDRGDDFVSGMQIILDGTRVLGSDFEGTYFFGGVEPGKHTLGIDINSLPIEYLPKIKLKNEIEVSEGSTYIFHIPLDRARLPE